MILYNDLGHLGDGRVIIAHCSAGKRRDPRDLRTRQTAHCRPRCPAFGRGLRIRPQSLGLLVSLEQKRVRQDLPRLLAASTDAFCHSRAASAGGGASFRLILSMHKVDSSSKISYNAAAVWVCCEYANSVFEAAFTPAKTSLSGRMFGRRKTV